jgi:Ferritin-like domain
MVCHPLQIFIHLASLHASYTISDTAVLNFALTLEHLENAFYTKALGMFDEAAFAAAGLPPFARGRFVQIGDHEKTHVAFLTQALGDKATQPCTYDLYVPFSPITFFLFFSNLTHDIL